MQLEERDLLTRILPILGIQNHHKKYNFLTLPSYVYIYKKTTHSVAPLINSSEREKNLFVVKMQCHKSSPDTESLLLLLRLFVEHLCWVNFRVGHDNFIRHRFLFLLHGVIEGTE